MPRVKRGVTARARHKKVLDAAKGYRGRRSRVYRVAKQAVMRAGQYAYRDRRNKKRVFRALWITRINAAACYFGFFISFRSNRNDNPMVNCLCDLFQILFSVLVNWLYLEKLFTKFFNEPFRKVLRKEMNVVSYSFSCHQLRYEISVL